MGGEVRVFTSSKHYHSWIVANCAKCKKETNFGFACPLTMAALKSLYFDGYLPRDIAKRIGYPAVDDALESNASPIWSCSEFEPKQ